MDVAVLASRVSRVDKSASAQITVETGSHVDGGGEESESRGAGMDTWRLHQMRISANGSFVDMW